MRWALALLGAIVALTAVRGFAAEGARPNIVFILTDDQGYGDLGCTGNPVVKTPNIDRLAGESVRFTDFQASPTCAPTRCSLMSGRHEFKSGVTHTILERERMSLKATTLPQVLAAAGYTNGIFGKWHLGDEDPYQPDKRGFQEVFIHGAGGIGQTYAGSCGDAPGNTYFSPAIKHNGKFVKTDGYCTDVFFAQATRWIEAQKGRGPFLAWIATNAPHGPLNVPDEYRQKYAGKVPENVAKFFGMIENIDDNVGRLLAKIKELGIENDTIVVFMTDNGGTAGCKLYNAGMRGTKGTPWNGGTHVPFFVRWPGKFAAGDRKQLTAHVDVFPTLAEIAGAKVPAEVAAKFDGRSLLPLLKDAAAPWPERFLFTHVGRWERGKAVESKYRNCSVRMDRYHLVSAGGGGRAAGRARAGAGAGAGTAPAAEAAAAGQANWELYDLQADPAEATDVAAAHPDVVRKMSAAYDAWWAEVLPCMENENLDGPKVNPFKEQYWKQFGGGPGANSGPRANSGE